jgi:hypothetical protein
MRTMKRDLCSVHYTTDLTLVRIEKAPCSPLRKPEEQGYNFSLKSKRKDLQDKDFQNLEE